MRPPSIRKWLFYLEELGEQFGERKYLLLNIFRSALEVDLSFPLSRQFMSTPFIGLVTIANFLGIRVSP